MGSSSKLYLMKFASLVYVSSRLIYKTRPFAPTVGTIRVLNVQSTLGTSKYGYSTGIPTCIMARSASGDPGNAMSSSSSSNSSKNGRQRGTTHSSSSNSSNIPWKYDAMGVPPDYVPAWFRAERARVLTPKVCRVVGMAMKDESEGEGNYESVVYYWMQRDVRSEDNWALLFAAHLATLHNASLRVVHVLSSSEEVSSTTGRMTERHASFRLGGLQRVEQELSSSSSIAVSVPLEVVLSDGEIGGGVLLHRHVMSMSTKRKRVAAVVCDMSPLRCHRTWTEKQAAPLFEQDTVPVYQVDAHNVVPVWYATDKREVGARTLRPKIEKVFSKFVDPPFPTLSEVLQPATPTSTSTSKNASTSPATIDWDECHRFLDPDPSVGALDWAIPGTKAALDRFRTFRGSDGGLKDFDKLRNNPTLPNICSNLSPWINHGHVSFQKLAADLRRNKIYPNGTAAFIEEGVVRRELSDNYVFYAPDGYDSFEGAAVWARESLELHASDERDHVYTRQELEEGRTHEDLWNAAQLQLVHEGKMHGFLRMYWAKKILEWTPAPVEALDTAQYLNDRYSLDGNDPNGFVGVGWSIMGVHDMGWKERPVFGKIRYMNYAGCKRKFDVANFVAKYPAAAANAREVGGANAVIATATKPRTKKRKGRS